MNIDTVAGEGTVTKGRIEKSLGDAIQDPLLQREGITDQVSGTIRQAFGGLRDFVRRQPVAATLVATLAGAVFLTARRRTRG